jgi:peptidoglycan-associated lipoprotein
MLNQRFDLHLRSRLTLTLSSLLLTAAAFTGCSGAGPAKSEMTKAIGALEAARKTNCPHDSLTLAEQNYNESKLLFDEGDYDKARDKASVAEKLAQEALKASGGKPCELPSTEVKSEVERDFPPEINPPAEVESEEVEEMKVVYFDFDSSQLSPETIVTLDQNLLWIEANSEQSVVLEGHCDVRGSTEYNIALSERRALAVEGYLLKSGVTPERVKVEPYGSERPVSMRRDAEGHRLNRRVEFRAR